MKLKHNCSFFKKKLNLYMKTKGLIDIFDWVAKNWPQVTDRLKFGYVFFNHAMSFKWRKHMAGSIRFSSGALDLLFTKNNPSLLKRWFLLYPSISDASNNLGGGRNGKNKFILQFYYNKNYTSPKKILKSACPTVWQLCPHNKVSFNWWQTVNPKKIFKV